MDALGAEKAWRIQNPLISGDQEQLAAIDYLLRSRDLAVAVQGPAGSGKTTFATEGVKAIETLSGRRVLVLAPSSSAADELGSLALRLTRFNYSRLTLSCRSSPAARCSGLTNQAFYRFG